MKVEFDAGGLRDGCRPEREKGWWAAKLTSSSTTPDRAQGRRGIVILVSGCRRTRLLAVSGASDQKSASKLAAEKVAVRRLTDRTPKNLRTNRECH